MERVILHWGEMGTRWGVNRSVAQIHALLYLLQEPLCADDIVDALSMARSNVSNSLKELQSWGLVSVTHVLGDRRDHFVAQADIWDVITSITRERKRRELDPTIAFLTRCADELDSEQETPAAVRKRIAELLDATRAVSHWYEQVSTLPRAVLLRMLKLGAGVGRLLSR